MLIPVLAAAAGRASRRVRALAAASGRVGNAL